MQFSADIYYHGPVVAFDLDDTLFRERDFCRSGFRYVEKLVETQTGVACPDLPYVMDMALIERGNPFDAMENYFATRGVVLPSQYTTQEIVRLYREHLPESLQPADGVVETLEWLADAGVRMCVVTDGRPVTQRNKIRALGIERYFHPADIIISGETGRDKHHPDNFARIVRHYPEAARFIYIGDNPEKDFFHPNIMGWTTVQAPPHNDNVQPPCNPAESIYLPQIRLTNFREIIEKCQL